MKRWRILVFTGLLGFGLGHSTSSHGAEPPRGRPTALDEYIAKADPTYSWKVVHTVPGRKSALAGDGNGVYVARVAKPLAGWTAFFVELVFASGEKVPFKFTTPVSIVPDTLPHRIEEFRLQAPSSEAKRP